jgi:hypothetical protein
MHFREVRSPDSLSLSPQDLVGQRLVSIDASVAPNSWVFHFERAKLQVGSLWRLVSSRQVTVTGNDHGQKFGHETSVDASSRLHAALDDQPITSAHLGPVNGDLTIEFGAISLQVVVSSAGYESWGLSRADGSQLVAISGGRVALFRSEPR